MSKIGVVDVGGGERGAYGAGVFDCMMDHDYLFDYCIGVSAGSANIASYLAHQRGRNYRFYTDYAFRKEYMGLEHLVRTGSYINLDYIYSTLSNDDGEDPIDYETMSTCQAAFEVVATEAITGQPHYFDAKAMKRNDYQPVKASSNVPLVDRAFRIGDFYYYDGGISDPIPFKKAFEYGCDKVVVILTRPKDFYRDDTKDKKQSVLLELKYPGSAKALANRAKTYNDELDEAKKLEEEGKVLIVAPDTINGMKTLTKDKKKIIDLYEKGLNDGMKVFDFIGLDIQK